VLSEIYWILKNYNYFYEVELNLLSPQYYHKCMTADTVYALLRIQDRQRNYYVYLRHFRATSFAVEKHVLTITYSELLSVNLIIQHAKVVRQIIFSFVTRPALQNFSTLFNRRLDFRGGKNLSKYFAILRIIQQGTFIYVHMLM